MGDHRADPNQRGLRACSSGLDLEPRLLEVEVALEAVHDLIGDPAVVPQLGQLIALSDEEEVHHPLVGPRAVLDTVILGLSDPHGEAPVADS